MSVGSPTVLLVDDEASTLAAIALTFRKGNFHVATATSAAEGLARLATGDVAVVVSDEHMPGMGGTAFLAEARRRHPNVIRMVLSGSSDPHSISRAVNEAGLFRYLLKPCKPTELVRAVEQGLEAYELARVRPAGSGVAVNVDHAIDALHVEFQPIFRFATGRLYGHEALLRLPAEFKASAIDVLDAAEREDQLWRCERAIRAAIAARMVDRPAGTLMFVNLDPKDLLDPRLYSRRDVLALHARAIVLEITERSSLAGIDDLSDRVTALRDLGYRIAIDDMGAGYSSLTTFVTLMPDFVKLDRDLINRLHEVPAKRKLVASLASVCAGLGISTVAEGIECQEELMAARQAGCTHAQGFLLGRPGPNFVQPADVPVTSH